MYSLDVSWKVTGKKFLNEYFTRCPSFAAVSEITGLLKVGSHLLCH
ncbi:hypothetical protein GCM10012287_57230 [Streptomyces daqingensis]|uniref:Uncharacterized protein n=1 Tax=Streptomyces daqingensis TaxID=1472640 RepID=A0ABQ2MU50_9ACTN|nr:hypothetical protein GCM10012287_57230 [Streptomyces daqingensis]